MTVRKTILGSGLLVLAACGSTEAPQSLGLSLQVRVPTSSDDNPFALVEAGFVALTAEGGAPYMSPDQHQVVQAYQKGLSLDLSSIPFGSQRQVRVEVWSKGADGRPSPPVLGRGISVPVDILASGAATAVHPYVTRTNRFAPPITDDGGTSTLEARAGACVAQMPGPQGITMFIGGAEPKDGAKNPYDIASYGKFLDTTTVYVPDTRATIPFDFAHLTTPRAFQGCAVGASTVAVVGGTVMAEDGTPKPTKSIEYFDLSVKLDGASNPFRTTQTGTPECATCNPGLVFARSAPSVVRMFADDNYYLILGGQGDVPCHTRQCTTQPDPASIKYCTDDKGCGADAGDVCLPPQEIDCAGNTWEVWNAKRGNLAQGRLAKARWNHGTAFIATPTGGYVVLVGGENDVDGALADFEVLEFNNRGRISTRDSTCPDNGEAGSEACPLPSAGGLSSWAWKPLVNTMPVPRVLPGVVYIASPPSTPTAKAYNYIVMVGGFTDAAKTKLDNTIDIFDIIGGGLANEHGSLTLSAARGAPMVAAVTSGSRQGQVLVAGGTTAQANAAPAEFIFFNNKGDDPIAKVVPVDPSGLLPDGSRTLGNAVGLNTGHILLGGGVGNSDLAPRTSLWLWNPF